MIAQIKPDSELSALEVVRRVFKKHPEVLQYEEIITLMMINFAKQMCLEQREICAGEATANIKNYDEPFVNQSSIINSPLPTLIQ